MQKLEHPPGQISDTLASYVEEAYPGLETASARSKSDRVNLFLCWFRVSERDVAGGLIPHVPGGWRSVPTTGWCEVERRGGCRGVQRPRQQLRFFLIVS